MNVKRYIFASLAVFVTFQLLNFVIHQLLLSDIYTSLQKLWRPEMMELMWIMYVTAALFSFIFVYIFIQGHEDRGLLEGARFGFILGVMLNGMNIFGQYVVYPVPLKLAILWFTYSMIQIILCGIVAAFIYSPRRVNRG